MTRIQIMRKIFQFSHRKLMRRIRIIWMPKKMYKILVNYGKRRTDGEKKAFFVQFALNPDEREAISASS